MNIFKEISKNYHKLKPNSQEYENLDLKIKEIVSKSTLNQEEGKIILDNFGEIIFPYKKLGKIDSLNFFCLNEFIMFTYYLANKNNYKNVVDVGSCLGLHSIILNKCGYNVTSYEPDKDNLLILNKYLSLNKITNNKTINKAIFDNSTNSISFNVIHDNRTGNHVVGSKSNLHGSYETIVVEVDPLKKIMKNNQLVKLDIEGAEAKAIKSTSLDDWNTCDIITEVHDKINSKEIYNFCEKLGLNLFSQNNNWNIVNDIDIMPKSYHDGAVFISKKKNMEWNIEI